MISFGTGQWGSWELVDPCDTCDDPTPRKTEAVYHRSCSNQDPQTEFEECAPDPDTFITSEKTEECVYSCQCEYNLKINSSIEKH